MSGGEPLHGALPVVQPLMRLKSSDDGYAVGGKTREPPQPRLNQTPPNHQSLGREVTQGDP